MNVAAELDGVGLIELLRHLFPKAGLRFID
jgi:hypothetical protein